MKLYFNCYQNESVFCVCNQTFSRTINYNVLKSEDLFGNSLFLREGESDTGRPNTRITNLYRSTDYKLTNFTRW